MFAMKHISKKLFNKHFLGNKTLEKIDTKRYTWNNKILKE